MTYSSDKVAAGEQMQMWMSIILYSICSGSLLLMNKVVLLLIPSPSLVISIQCTVVVLSIGGCRLLFNGPSISPITRPVVSAYALYSVLFVLGIYSNMRSLQVSNVDTVIVFRSAVPLLVAAGDWLWMGRQKPSLRSLASMLAVIAGCSAFVAVDAEFSVRGWAAYGWVSFYLLCIASEMLLGKAITSTHEVTLGTSVLITNSLAIVPFLLIGASTGELQRGCDSRYFTLEACTALAISCALSAGIGFSSWWCRSLTSATTFTVIGTLNKFLTVLLNIALWSKHASPLGTGFLLMCLAGGAFYQQAPLRLAAASEYVTVDTAPTPEPEPEPIIFHHSVRSKA